MTMNILDDLARDDPQIERSGFLRASFSPSENWDDDFEVQPRMPESSRVGHDDATNAPAKSGPSTNAEESWDDAYEDEDQNAAPVKRPRKVDDDEIEDWDSSDNEINDQHEPGHDQCTRHKAQCDFDGGFEEEDKTVTARSTTSSRDRTYPLLPIPSFSSRTHDLQHPPFPPNPFQISPVSPQHPAPSTSPTLSSFSIPLSSNRASIYSQEPLVPTVSNSSAPHLTLLRAYPQSAGSTPPKKGRRLRKKSRPPEADIYELEDHEPDQLLVSVPESPRLPPVLPSPPRPMTPTDAPVSQPTSPSILTRIGSFKRWARRSIGPEDISVIGSRRKKSSTDQGETHYKTTMGAEGLPIAEESSDRELHTVSPTPTPNKSRLRRNRGSSASGQKAGWFFHSGGGGGNDKEEVNIPIIPSVPAAAPGHTLGTSPSKSSALGMRWRRKEKEAGDDEGTPTLKTNGRLTPVVMAGASVSQSNGLPGAVEDAYRSRPVSLQLQAHSQPPRPLQFPRHRGTASVGRSAGNSLPFMVADTERPPHQIVERPERETGVRGLMGGVRRLSLVGGAHKRTKSIGADAAPPEAAQNKTSTPGRPRSSTEILQVPKAWVSLRMATQGPTIDQELRGDALEEVPTLLPPVELDSPSRLAHRDSFPWIPYDPINSMSPNHEPPIDFTVRKSMVPQSINPPPASFDTPVHRPEHLTSTSTTSLIAGSQSRPTPVPTTPATPSLSSSSPISPDSPHGPALPTLPPSSPRTGSASVAPPAMYTASLGRSTVSPAHAGSALRRNSLGDFKMQTPPRGELKIPARISRAQQGLRRDLGMVREFAACVEQLKQLQGKYNMLIDELRTMYESSFPNLRSMSPPPVQYHLPSRPPSRPSSQIGTARRVVNVNQNPSLQSVTSPTTTARNDVGRELLRLEHEYGIWWECAELLVELGGGSVASSRTASNPNLTSTAPSFTGELEESPNGSASRLAVVSASEPGSVFEQAPLEKGNGPPQASPPQWRASTGRHDLSARQLRLLKDMLNTPDPASLAYSAEPYGYGAVYPSFPYSVEEGQDSSWPSWNPSAVTLPSEESSTDPHPSRTSSRNDERRKKPRMNRLGLLGLRELLRGLKRNAMAEGRLHGAYPQGMQRSESSASNSADDYYNRRRSPWHQHDEHHKRRHDDDPPPDVPDVPPIPHKSPRRPSLASIFRLGQASKNGKHKNKERPSSRKGNTADDDMEPESHTDGGRAPDEYSDWERMSQSDVDLTATGFGSGTIRGKRKPPLSNFSSNPSLLQSHSPPSATLSSPRRAHSASQTSLLDTSPSSGTSPRQTNLPLLMAEEHLGAQRQQKPNKPRDPQSAPWTRANGASRPGSRNGKAAATGTVRSAPPSDLSSMPDLKLALTPETIKPLLEYAKEVSVRLGGCIGEVQALLNNAMPIKAA